ELAQETQPRSTLEILAQTVRRGLTADPAAAFRYVKLMPELVSAAGKATAGKRGLTIILPRGGGYDPMARPRATLVLASGAGESQKTRDTKPDAVPGPAEPADDGLGVG